MIARLIGRLICWRKGHRRGGHVANENGLRIFACPRCGRRTTYRVKA